MFEQLRDLRDKHGFDVAAVVSGRQGPLVDKLVSENIPFHVANFAAGIEVGKAGVATVSPAEVLAVHETYYDQLGKLRREGLL